MKRCKLCGYRARVAVGSNARLIIDEIQNATPKHYVCRSWAEAKCDKRRKERGK